MTLVFINIKSKCVEVYTEQGFRTISVSNTQVLNQLLKDKEVLYVTKAIKTTGNKILKTISTIKPDKKQNKNNEPLFIRSAKKTCICINELKLTFNGLQDFKPVKDLYDKYGKNILTENKVLASLLNKNALELLTLSEVQQEQLKEAEKEDEELDSIMVNTSAAEAVASSGSSKRDRKRDAIEIDMTGDFGGSGVRSIGKTSSQLNEGGLLPDDF